MLLRMVSEGKHNRGMKHTGFEYSCDRRCSTVNRFSTTGIRTDKKTIRGTDTYRNMITKEKQVLGTQDNMKMHSRESVGKAQRNSYIACKVCAVW